DDIRGVVHEHDLRGWKAGRARSRTAGGAEKDQARSAVRCHTARACGWHRQSRSRTKEFATVHSRQLASSNQGEFSPEGLLILRIDSPVHCCVAETPFQSYRYVVRSSSS